MDIGQALKIWQKLMIENNTDVFYLSSFDHYLSEYVPTEDSVRVCLTGFTGSVAEALLFKEGRIKLFVDARYHEQADKECNLDLIDVVKVPFGVSLSDALKETLPASGRIGILGERTSIKLVQSLFKDLEVRSFTDQEILPAIGFNGPEFSGELFCPDYEKENFWGKWVNQLKDGQAAFVNALDTTAWASGLRASHLPYQGTFRALAMLTKEGMTLFCEKAVYEEVLKFQNEKRKVLLISDFKEVISSLKGIDEILYDPSWTTTENYKILVNYFEGNLIAFDKGFHAGWQAFKTSEEMSAFRESFNRSDKAIYNGLKWLADSVRAGQSISEVEFRNKVEEFYKKEGAKLQSFRTISGFGPSSSIIHFGSPSKDKKCEEGELVLLDSGAIYKEFGMATDCTRTILPIGQASAEQKKEYTLVLKGLIRVLMAKVPVGTEGKVLDELARGPLKEHGLNYGHGTGHGVGVNVHEAGYSMRPESVVPLLANTVGSVEPGFYRPGVGGIRLENIVIVKECRDDNNMLEFENLVHIGFWPGLIDESLLSADELSFLEAYEKKCAELGRSFQGY